MNRPNITSFLACAGLLMATACSMAATPSGASGSAAPQLFALEPTPDRSTLQRTGNDYLKRLLTDPANEQVTLIKLAPALVNNQTQDLAVTLPDGTSAQFHLRDFNTITDGIQGWVGYKASTWKQVHTSSSAEIDNDPQYYLSLAREGDTLVGSIIADGQHYRIDQAGPGQHVLIKVDASKMPKEAEPRQVEHADAVDETIGKVPQSGHSVIRILFLATDQRKAASPNYKLELAKAVNDANQYLRNSQVDMTYELAGYYEGSYDETDRAYKQQLDDIRLAQPFAEAVLSRREELRAHVVSMYSTAPQFCGMAWLSASKAQAHSVISCPGSLAHELGHNMGVNHGWVPGDPVRNPPYMHGYKRTATPALHTIMITSHGAIPYFSNPRLTYQGVALGTVANHDAARRFNERRETVENFYPPLPILTTKVTVYDNLQMKGEHCTFELPNTHTEVLIETACPGWQYKVWSARVQGINPKATLRLGNNSAWHTYRSDYYAGDFDIPTLNRNELALPDGMTMTPQNGNLSKKIDRVTILP